jgi:hypothetical protein
MRFVVQSFTVMSLGFGIGVFGAAVVSSLQFVESDRVTQSQRDPANTSMRWCPPGLNSTKEPSVPSV